MPCFSFYDSKYLKYELQKKRPTRQVRGAFAFILVFYFLTTSFAPFLLKDHLEEFEYARSEQDYC